MRRLRQLASESVIYGLAGVLTRFLMIFLVPIYTRIFSPEDYGVISLVTSTMAVVTIFVVLALDNSAHRWYWETEDRTDQKQTLASWAWCQLVVSSSAAAVIIGLAHWLARTIVGRDEAVLAFQLSALALPIGTLGTVAVNWLRMMRRPWATMGYSLATSLTHILLTVLLVAGLGWGIRGVFIGQLAAAAVGSLAAILLMRGWLHPRYVRWERLRAMLRFGLPLIPAALSFWVVSLADRYFVQFYTSTSEVGLYALGSTIAALIVIVTNAFQQAWGPFALSIHRQPDARYVYANVFLIYLWLTCALSTALTLFAPEALRLIATEAYVGAAGVVGFLALSTTFSGLTSIAAIGPQIVKTNVPTGVAITCAALLNIALNIVFVPRLGKSGAALATLLSQALVPLYLFYRSQQLYPLPYRFGPGVGFVALAGVIMAIGSLWQAESLWLGIAVKLLLCMLFLPAPLLFRALTLTQTRELVRAAAQHVPAPGPRSTH